MNDISTDMFASNLRDWRNVSATDHRLTNAEYIEQFGNPRSTPDTNNATWFRPEDVEPSDARWPADFNPVSKFKYYKKLVGYNDGSWNLKTEHKQYTTYRQKNDLCDIISSQLRLSPKQRGRVRSQTRRLHLGKFGDNIVLTIYCVCAYAVHSDYLANQSIRPCHPRTNPEERDPVFVQFEEQLRDSYGIPASEIESMYGKVQNDLREWPNIRGKRTIGPKYRPNGAVIRYDKYGMDDRGTTGNDDVELDDAVGRVTR